RGESDKAKNQAAVDKQAAATDVKNARQRAQKDIDKAQADANVKVDAAHEATVKANGQRIGAEHARSAAEKLRNHARAEAQKQAAISDSRSLANRSVTLLHQNPDNLTRSLELATESMKRCMAAGYRTVEADSALRDTIAMFPQLRSSDRFAGHGHDLKDF